MEFSKNLKKIVYRDYTDESTFYSKCLYGYILTDDGYVLKIWTGQGEVSIGKNCIIKIEPSSKSFRGKLPPIEEVSNYEG